MHVVPVNALALVDVWVEVEEPIQVAAETLVGVGPTTGFACCIAELTEVPGLVVSVVADAATRFVHVFIVELYAIELTGKAQRERIGVIAGRVVNRALRASAGVSWSRAAEAASVAVLLVVQVKVPDPPVLVVSRRGYLYTELVLVVDVADGLVDLDHVHIKPVAHEVFFGRLLNAQEVNCALPHLQRQIV